MPANDTMARQRVLADFGDFALRSEKLDDVLTEACRLVAEALGTRRAKVLEIRNNGRTLFVRAGVGWAPGVVGVVELAMSERSSETFSIAKRVPVITQDIHEEKRFHIPEFMKQAGVVALVNVPIVLPGGRAFGLLQVDSTERRDFGEEDIEFLRTYAIILGPVIDRLEKAHALEVVEERFRLTVENAKDYAIFVCDADDRILDWLPGAEAVFGWTREEATGKPSAMLFTPEDRAAGADREEIETARARGSAPDVRWHLRKDGSRVFIDGSITKLTEGDSIVGFLKIGRDATDRVEAERKLRESAESMKLAVDVGRLGTWDWNMKTGEVSWSDSHFQILGYPVGSVSPSYEAWRARVHPDDLAEAEAELQAAMREHREFEHEFRSLHPDGEVRWCTARGQFYYDENGQPRRMIGAMLDRTEERQWTELQTVLVGELQHRTRNIIGLIRAMAGQMARSSTSVPEFTEQFNARLDALARVTGLLAKLDDGQRIAFDDIVRTELSAHGVDDPGDPRCTIRGPKGIRLRSSTVQIVALALHELATNAVKHGALSTPGGRLTLEWKLDTSPGGAPTLRIAWQESGVPADDTTASRQGFGRALIERALPYQLKADVTYDLTPDGVRCTMVLPLATKER